MRQSSVLLLAVCVAPAWPRAGSAAARRSVLSPREDERRSVLSPREDDTVARVVDARLSANVHSGSMLHNLSSSNATKAANSTNLLQAPQLLLLRSAAWIRKHDPGLWLMLVTGMAQLHRGAREGQRRAQVELGRDYHIAIVTTAALPWMTGTAVNPLLRAANLAKAGRRVTLMMPWLHPLEQAMIFPAGVRFDTPAEQQRHILEWLRRRAGLGRARFRLVFYPGRYDGERGSILPLGDITRFFAPDECDVAVLEEPEHLTWYHNGEQWRFRFKLVVGVVHTNYLFYAQTWENGGPLLAGTLKAINQILCQAYCDKVIKLSDSLQPLPRALVCNVHGVRADFLAIGRRARRRRAAGRLRGAYYIGKTLWAKGFRLLLDYLQLQQESRVYEPTPIDVFGSGEDQPAIEHEVGERALPLRFHGPTDHAGPTLRNYKVFVNPSQSEVLSTTTAEALAMGKFAVLQRHPSNAFFEGFANALFYETPEEFLSQLRFALASAPAPLSADEANRLSWEGATQRFLHAVTDESLGSSLPSLPDHWAHWLHQTLQKGGPLADEVRKATGAGPVARQSWLSDPRFRDASPVEVVEQSLRHSPPSHGLADVGSG